MSSTRNINQQYDYNVKKRESSNFLNYISNINYHKQASPAFMELGSNAKLPAEQLCRNYIDVESMLRGIRSTNLEGDSFRTVPINNNISDVKLFEKPKLVIPNSYKHSLVERPNYLN